MATATYEVTVKLPNGNNEKIRLEASSHGNAKTLASCFSQTTPAISNPSQLTQAV